MAKIKTVKTTGMKEYGMHPKMKKKPMVKSMGKKMGKIKMKTTY